MIHICPVSCLSLEQIAASGQCFTMEPAREGWWSLISRKHRALASQDSQGLILDCQPQDLDFWLNYFDMDTDYQAVIDSVSPKDPYLRAAAAAGRGIRILRQDPWEMIITFVISQQKTIPHIRRLVQSLSRRWGTCLPAEGGLEPAWAFPSPGQLSQASLEELLELKLGYRAKYIWQLAQDAQEGRLDLIRLRQMNYDQAMEYLTGFYGIGKKIASCVCLYGLHHIEAFPVDTWISKILMREYYNPKKYRRTPKNHLLDQLVQDHFGQYGGYAGILQQYIFYYERVILQDRPSF